MKKNRLTAASAMAALALLAAGCTDPGSSAGGAASSLTVNMAFGRGEVTQNYNPFSTTATEGTNGLVFEPLMGINILHSGSYTPWLASSQSMTPDGKTLTIKLNPQATWNDGSPVTADDVVFTFNILKKYPATNWSNGVTFDTVTAKDAHTVVMTFSSPSFTQVPGVVKTEIVPKKSWQGKNPLTFTNPNPVGSGPYKEGKLTAQQVTLHARSDYWEQKNIPVKTVNFPIVNPATETNALLQGTEDWSGGALPNVMANFVNKDPKHNQAWYPTYGANFLFFNNDKPLFKNVHVRRAVSLAMDKQQMIDLLTQTGATPISQTGLDPVTQGKWVDPAYTKAIATNTSAAIQELGQAGYHLKGGKMVDASGKQLAFTIMEVATFADSVQRDKIIATQLGKIGISVTVDPQSQGTYTANQQKGDFDALTGGYAYGGTPWSMYNSLLNSKFAGTASGGPSSYENWGRWRDPQTDGLLNQLAAAPTDAQQVQLTHQLEKIMVDQVPVVTLSNITAGCAYSMKNWTGWPSASNPYAMCSPWIGGPDNAQVLLHLKPASGS